MRILSFVALACLLTTGCAGISTKVLERPDTQPKQYRWDVKCLAADHELFRQVATDPDTGGDAISSQLRAAAIDSGAANGKNSDAVLAETRSAARAYLRNSRPYYGRTAAEMRAECIMALVRTGGIRTGSSSD